MDYQLLIHTNLHESYAILTASFKRSLLAANKSPRTIATYLDALYFFGLYLQEKNMPQDVTVITREYIESFLTDQLQKHKPSTAATRYKSLNVFFNWLMEEGELVRSPMERIKVPFIPDTPPEVLTEEQLKSILKACEGREFPDRRDMAIVRILIDTGLRKSEIANIRIEDIDLDLQVIRIPRAKGGGGKTVVYGHKSAQALDRYLRLRSRIVEKGRTPLNGG